MKPIVHKAKASFVASFTLINVGSRDDRKSTSSCPRSRGGAFALVVAQVDAYDFADAGLLHGYSVDHVGGSRHSSTVELLLFRPGILRTFSTPDCRLCEFQ